MAARRINRTDFLAGLAVTIAGAAALVEALRMPRFETRGADPFTVPGLTPGLLSAVLCVLGAVLLLRGLSGHMVAEGARPSITRWDRASAIRSIFTVVSVLVYGVLLFGRMPFMLATALFVFAFTIGAELINAERRLSTPMLVIGALVLAVVAAFAINFVFTDLFLVRLPG
ncbi:tripartite tricarboxylate transporter TctB family protein [Nitratireductor soli]|uniref:tripartite tricarboxylate transporter TctB family protein n=1 Tax=Nitratireductor soli TaxID=1670619 RepID=UPI00065E7BB3|nr:tripartite tricarboxylate transporter TctB family protein [Nitratireductor soli]